MILFKFTPKTYALKLIIILETFLLLLSIIIDEEIFIDFYDLLNFFQKPEMEIVIDSMNPIN